MAKAAKPRAHVDDHALAVDVGDSQPGNLGAAHSAIQRAWAAPANATCLACFIEPRFGPFSQHGPLELCEQPVISIGIDPADPSRSSMSFTPLSRSTTLPKIFHPSSRQPSDCGHFLTLHLPALFQSSSIFSGTCFSESTGI
jgi:hypothetical protein